jgi:hypothetical protein
MVCGRTEGGSSVAFGHSVWVTEKRFDLVNARLLYLAPRRAVPLKDGFFDFSHWQLFHSNIGC